MVATLPFSKGEGNNDVVRYDGVGDPVYPRDGAGEGAGTKGTELTDAQSRISPPGLTSGAHVDVPFCVCLPVVATLDVNIVTRGAGTWATALASHGCVTERVLSRV